MSLEETAVTGFLDAGRMEDLPDPEVAPRAVKRTFTAAYKKILAEYDVTPRTDHSALLRREKLYSSLIGKVGPVSVVIPTLIASSSALGFLGGSVWTI